MLTEALKGVGGTLGDEYAHGFDGGDDEPYEDPYGKAWTWEKQQEKWEEEGSTDESLFINQAHWEAERQKAHSQYMGDIAAQGAAAASSQQQQQQQQQQRPEEERYEDREQREEREEEDIKTAWESREEKDIWGGGLGEMSREEFEAAYGHRYR